MSFSPAPAISPVPLMLSPLSELSLGQQLASAAAVVPASAVWPSANLGIYVPFALPRTMTVLKLWWLNGATVAGNVDVGIYDAALNKVIASGATAQATINVLQAVDIADTVLPGPANYYMALSASLGTATFFRTTPVIEALKAMGCAQQASAHPLPASLTLAAIAQAYLPIFGLAFRTLT